MGNEANAEAQSSLVRVTKYYYHGGRRVAMRAGGVVYYLHGDHLGSVSLVTDAAGRVYARRLFRPYGGTRWQAGTLPTDFGFTGQREDGSTGLVFMHARYYDARLGRFISADTVVPGAGNPQALNRYSYVLNSPIKYTDPSGHRECGPYCEGEIIDERTIGTQYAGPYDPLFTAREQYALLEPSGFGGYANAGFDYRLPIVGIGNYWGFGVAVVANPRSGELSLADMR